MPLLVARLMIALVIAACQGGQKQQGPLRGFVGNIHPGKLLVEPKPEMPHLAVIAHIHGAVHIEAIVDTDGSIAELHVLSGHPFLIPAAMEAALHHRHAPALLNCVPVRALTTITIHFNDGPRQTIPIRPPD